MGPGGCVIDMRECSCDCHYTKSKKHIMPCCYQCAQCGKNIKKLFIKDHIKECEEERRKLKALLDKE